MPGALIPLKLVYSGDLSDIDLGRVPREVPLPTEVGEVFTIGRANDNSCFMFSPGLPDAVRTTVSRYHAHVIVVGSEYTIRDLDSMNGTFIDEVRIDKRVSTTFGQGSVLVFGGK